MVRASITLVLAVAFAAGPLILDQCAASCEVARAAGASAPAPTCHHEGSPVEGIGQPPQGCGHDHNAVAGPLPVAPIPTGTVMSTLAVITSLTSVDIAVVDTLEEPLASPPSTIPSRALSLSLRI